MSVSFDAPLALLLLIPALLLTIGLHLGARRRVGSGRRRVAAAATGSREESMHRTGCVGR